MIRRIGATLALALVFVVAFASAASAHAELESTTPSSGAILDRAPEAIELQFSERVSVDEVKVFDAGLHRVDTGKVEKPSGNVVRAPLKSDLPNGGYVVAWRVVSADSHPISGGFTFRVGASSTAVDASVVQTLLEGQKAPRATGVVLGIVRFVAFLSLLLLVGGSAFVSWLYNRGATDRRLRTLLWSSLATLGVATVLGIALQAASVAGRGLGSAMTPSNFADAFDTTFGRVWLLRLALLVPAAILLRSIDRAGRPLWRAAGVAVGAALLWTPVMTGHADTGRWVGWAKAFDLLHLGAAAVWLGGLAILLTCVLRPGVEDAKSVTERFSPIAFGAVAAVVLSGSFQSVRQLYDLDGLDTTYGHILIVKVVIVLLLVGIAALTRAALQGRLPLDDVYDDEDQADAPVLSARGPSIPSRQGPGAQHVDEHREIGILRRLVAAEVVVAILVLAVTALLVDANPGHAGTTAAGPFDQTHVVDDVLINAVVLPGVIGPTDVHLYVDNPGGGLTPPVGVKATLSLASGGITGIDVPLVDAGGKHWIANDVDVPIPGDWKLDVEVLLTDVDQATTSFTVPIGGSS